MDTIIWKMTEEIHSHILKKSFTLEFGRIFGKNNKNNNSQAMMEEGGVNFFDS